MTNGFVVIEYSLKQGIDCFKEDMKSAYTHEHLAKDVMCLITTIYNNFDNSFPYLKKNEQLYKDFLFHFDNA